MNPGIVYGFENRQTEAEVAALVRFDDDLARFEQSSS